MFSLIWTKPLSTALVRLAYRQGKTTNRPAGINCRGTDTSQHLARAPDRCVLRLPVICSNGNDKLLNSVRNRLYGAMRCNEIPPRNAQIDPVRRNVDINFYDILRQVVWLARQALHILDVELSHSSTPLIPFSRCSAQPYSAPDKTEQRVGHVPNRAGSRGRVGLHTTKQRLNSV